MTAESLEAAVFNAPREVQVQILKQLNDRYPDETTLPTENGSDASTKPKRQGQRLTNRKTPPITDEERVELLRRMETLDDSYTLEEIMAKVDETLASEDSQS